jgi:hypothetical protein
MFFIRAVDAQSRFSLELAVKGLCSLLSPNRRADKDAGVIGQVLVQPGATGSDSFGFPFQFPQCMHQLLTLLAQRVQAGSLPGQMPGADGPNCTFQAFV